MPCHLQRCWWPPCDASLLASDFQLHSSFNTAIIALHHGELDLKHLKRCYAAELSNILQGGIAKHFSVISDHLLAHPSTMCRKCITPYLHLELLVLWSIVDEVIAKTWRVLFWTTLYMYCTCIPVCGDGWIMRWMLVLWHSTVGTWQLLIGYM